MPWSGATLSFMHAWMAEAFNIKLLMRVVVVNNLLFLILFLPVCVSALLIRHSRGRETASELVCAAHQRIKGAPKVEYCAISTFAIKSEKQKKYFSSYSQQYKESSFRNVNG